MLNKIGGVYPPYLNPRFTSIGFISASSTLILMNVSLSKEGNVMILNVFFILSTKYLVY